MSRISNDPQVIAEITALVNAFSATDVADPAAVTITSGGVAVTFTTDNPVITPNAAVTIADGDTPTVAELLEFCVELNAQIVKARADVVEIRAQLIALLDSLNVGGVIS